MAAHIHEAPAPMPTVAQALRMLSTTLEQMTALAKAMADQLEEERSREAEAQQRGSLSNLEFAEEFGISEASVRNLVKAGRIKAEWHGKSWYRIPRSEVFAYRRRISRGPRS
jgi:hypothetical protein